MADPHEEQRQREAIARRLTSVPAHPTVDERRTLLQAVRVRGRQKAKPDPGADRSGDFLYDENGLPR
ncbi:hypothetical protein ACFQX4_17930 [Roseomonas sp. GCM10028921]